MKTVWYVPTHDGLYGFEHEDSAYRFANATESSVQIMHIYDSAVVAIEEQKTSEKMAKAYAEYDEMMSAYQYEHTYPGPEELE